VGFQSGYGDGVYDIYAYYNEDDIIVKVEIILEESDDAGEDETKERCITQAAY